MNFLFFPPSLPFRIQWQSSESSVGCQQCLTSCSVFLLWAPGCQRLTGPLYYSLTCRITTPPWRHRGRYQMSYDVSSQPTKLWEKHWADCHYVIMHFPRDLHLWEVRDANAEMDAEVHPSPCKKQGSQWSGWSAYYDIIHLSASACCFALWACLDCGWPSSVVSLKLWPNARWIAWPDRLSGAVVNSITPLCLDR